MLKKKTMNNNYMTDEEMNQFLESIGGLENGFFTDRPPIKSAGFFSCDKGWYGIIKRLIEDLIELGWNKQICQVKEKFGGLRFYINSGSEEVWQRIQLAESASYITCEKCGELGSLRKGGWIATLCDEHSEGRESFE
jgi:hypothetical protein